MIREEKAFDAPALLRPALGRRGGRAPDDDMVDGGPGLGEALIAQEAERLRPFSGEVEIA